MVIARFYKPTNGGGVRITGFVFAGELNWFFCLKQINLKNSSLSEE